MGQGRPQGVRGKLALAALVASAFAVPALSVAEERAGEPPVHPREGHWKGKTQHHSPVAFRVDGEWVRDLRGGGFHVKDAHIKHSRIQAHEPGLFITATFRDPRHVVGTIYPAHGRRPGDSRVSWHAHHDRD
jgi:hypothetical protein